MASEAALQLLVSSSLAGALFESFLYGFFLSLFLLSTYLFVRRAIANSVNVLSLFKMPLFASSIGMFIFVTAHWIVTVIRAFEAFVFFQGGTSALLYYSELSFTAQVVQIGLLLAALTICDAVFVYRLWCIWDRNNYVIIFPLCCMCGSTSCGYVGLYYFTKYQPGQDAATNAIRRWNTGGAAMTLSINLFCSTLIAWRLWRIHRALRTTQTHTFRSNAIRILIILIESAALFVIWAVLYLGVFESQTNFEAFVVVVWSPVAGIAFTLINARVALGWSSSGIISSQKSGLSSTGDGRSRLGTRRDHELSPSYVMQPVRVKITSDVVADGDGDLERGFQKTMLDDETSLSA